MRAGRKGLLIDGLKHRKKILCIRMTATTTKHFEFLKRLRIYRKVLEGQKGT